MRPFLRKGRAKLYIKVRIAPGQWSRPLPTGFYPEQMTEAEELQRTLQARADAGYTPDGPLTVRTYAERWLKDRKTHDVASTKDDETKLRLHILPYIGSLRMDEVRPRHIRDWLKKLRQAKKLVRVAPKKYRPGSERIAPRTAINAYSVARTMFLDAVVDEVIRATPCVLKRGDLPKKRDKDPEWRSGAIFTRAELEQVISAPEHLIPWDRRMLYALLFLTASRFGEAAALRWRHYDNRRKPLGRIVIAVSYNTKLKRVKETKKEQPRTVPVHPVLAKLLAEWRLSGWAQIYGREPDDDDLIVPARSGRNRSVNHSRKRFLEDLQRLGLRARRQHDARRTFRTIALDDGANESRLGWITHGRKYGVDGGYDEPPWQPLCEVVLAMRIQLRNREVAAIGDRG